MTSGPVFISRENLAKLGINPSQDTLTLTLANTEYSIAVPNKSNRVIFGLRSGSYSIKYGWATGALNFTVPAGVFRDISDVYLVSQTLFFKCVDSAGEIVELEFWGAGE